MNVDSNHANGSNKHKFIFMLSACYFCQILTKIEFHRQTLIQGNSIKFHENPSTVGRVVPCGRKDGQTRWSLKSRTTNLRNATENRLKATPTALTCLNRRFKQIKHWLTCRYHVGNLQRKGRGSAPLTCHGPLWESGETYEPLRRKFYLNT
jgi:hypothetical protein